MPRAAERDRVGAGAFALGRGRSVLLWALLAIGCGSEGGEPFDPMLCEESDGALSLFRSDIATFAAQDELGAPPPGGLVFVGSSSVRRWEDFARLYSDYGPVQRGFGGGQLSEVARFADSLIVAHAPRAVIVFAGANDVSIFGVAPDVVVDRFRCLRQRLARDLGPDLPILFIGITPTPARWEGWDDARAVNDAVRAIAESDAAVHYVDIPAAFLDTGAPPADSLFVEDGLHLNEEGYALWNGALRPAVEVVLDPLPPLDAPPAPALRPGEGILIDFGPLEAGRGDASASPDAFGRHWNNWHPLDAGFTAIAGQRVEGLVDAAGQPTAVGVVLSAGFGADGGTEAGGLLSPDEALLSSLAVSSATGDYFLADGPDRSGGLYLRGLDPAARYTLRIFATRQDAERRTTRYTVQGATAPTTALLQTSGDGAGSTAAPLNDDDVVEISGIQADPWGRIFVDVAPEEGDEGYLSALELIAEAP